MTRMCSRCLYDETIPGIVFDENGVCNYCHIHDQLDKEYPTGPEGEQKIRALNEKIKINGRGKKYDVIVGVSGGCDSSYLVYLTVNMGLRPLAVHFDNTWDTTVAVENIHDVLKKLDVDLYTYVVDNKEYDDIYRSFLRAGVIDIDAPTDVALAAVLNMVAEKYGVKYIFEGHSFRTEGVAPLGWIYMDAKYVESVQKKYGVYPLKTFPNLWLKDQMRWWVVRGLQKIRPLYYINYIKKDAMALLSKELGWEWYGGHHLENRFTAFTHTYFFPKRYNADTRLLGYAALVRSGQMAREQGLELLSQPQEYDPALIEFVQKRLGFSDEEFRQIITQPKRTYRDFKTYKRTFERMRRFFWLMYKLNRVPKSFYIKFTAPDPLPGESKAS
jgi:N-acetyl sugar amidotransferase